MITLALGDINSGFEAEFRFKADLEGIGTSVERHPSAALLPIFNGAYRQMREQLTQWGYTQYLVRGTTTSLPTSPVEAGETYAVIELGTAGSPGTPPALTQVKAIDVKLSNGRWKRLDELPFSQLRDRYVQPNGRGFPDGWCWLSDATTSGANIAATGKIAIFPVPNGGSYVLWTMPEITAPSGATHVYSYPNEDAKQWHMLRAMADVCGLRDKNTRAQVELILAQLDPKNDSSVAERLKNAAPTAAGPRTWTRSQNYNSRSPWG